MPKPSKGVPDVAEFNKLLAHLRVRGAKAPDLDAAVGESPSGRTRRQIAASLALWLRNRPKGGVRS